MKKLITFLTLSLLLSSASVSASQIYEAEAAVLSGGGGNAPTIENDAGASGGVCVYSREGEITFSINIAVAGFYNVYIAAKTADYRENNFQVDNGSVFPVDFNAGSGFSKVLVKVQFFSSGVHTVMTSKNWGWVYMDYLEVTAFTGQIYEAETATFTGGAGNVAAIEDHGDASENKSVYTKESNIVFNISIPETGKYDIYAYNKSDNGSTKQNYFKIDDSESANFNIAFPAGKSFRKTVITTNFQFSAGTHKIEMIKSWGWSYLDCIAVVKNTDATTSLIESKSFNTTVTVTGQTIIVQPQTKEIYQLQIRDTSGKLIISKANLIGETSINQLTKKGIYLLLIRIYLTNEVHKIVVN